VNLRTRLFLSTILGLVGICGLAAAIYWYLPQGMEEYLRRDTETRLAHAAKSMQVELESQGQELEGQLEKVVKKLQTGAGLDFENGASDAAVMVELARSLAKENSLDQLAVIDANSKILSIHPKAARIGLRDKDMRSSAEAAASRAIFESGDEGGLLVCKSRRLGIMDILVYAKKEIKRRDLEQLAEHKGLELLSDDSEHEGSDYLLPVDGQGGVRVATLRLGLPSERSNMLLRALGRRVLIVAVPWGLFFALLLIWLGWPPRKAKD